MLKWKIENLKSIIDWSLIYKSVIKRVHNIIFIAEYSTLHYSAFLLPSQKALRYNVMQYLAQDFAIKGLLIGVEWHWYIKRQVCADTTALYLHKPQTCFLIRINAIQHQSTGLLRQSFMAKFYARYCVTL